MPSALIHGRYISPGRDPPGDPILRRRMRLEQDVIPRCGKNPSLLLPLPTLAKDTYNEIVDDFAVLVRRREELRGMEAAERETRRFLKEERMYLLALRELKADEKAVGASLRFSKQRAGNLLRKWNAYCKKLKIIRRFAKKIMWRGLAKFMCSWKEFI